MKKMLGCDKYRDMEILGFNEQGKSLRLVGNHWLSETINHELQLWLKLKLCNNRLKFSKESFDYEIFYDEEFGSLFIADLRRNQRSPLCWKKNCANICGSADKRLLCNVHLKEDDDKKKMSTQVSFEPKDLEEDFLEFRRATNESEIKLASRNEDIQDEVKIQIMIGCAAHLLHRVNPDMFRFVDDFDINVKQRLVERLRNCTFTMGSGHLRYNDERGCFQFKNDERTNDEWRDICEESLCMRLAESYGRACVKHNGGWKATTFAAIMYACGVNKWDDLRELHLEVLKQEMEKQTKENEVKNGIHLDRAIYPNGKFIIKETESRSTNHYIYFDRQGELRCTYNTTIYSVCTNWAEGCMSVNDRRQKSCNQCRSINTFKAYLVYIKPYDAYITFSTKRQIRSVSEILTILIKPDYNTDLKPEDLEIVAFREEIISRELAESWIGAYIIVLIFKSLFGSREIRFLNSVPQVGMFPFRSAAYILGEYKISLIVKDEITYPSDFETPIILLDNRKPEDGREKLGGSTKPICYEVDGDDDWLYIGVKHNYCDDGFDVSLHHGNFKDKSSMAKLKLTWKQVLERGYAITELGSSNKLHYYAKSMETLCILAFFCIAERTNPGSKKPVNANLSATKMPKYAAYDLARISKHFGNNQYVWPTDTTKETWDKILEPSSRQNMDVNRKFSKKYRTR